MEKAKVLVVDDDEDLLKMLKRRLEAEGFEYMSAKDGKDMLGLIKVKRPDVIILDIMLPEMDGLEICKAIKNDTKTARIPIIILTAKAQEVDKIVGLELGADDYVTKPFSPRELIARIKAVLRRAKEKDKLPEVLKIGDMSIDFAKIMVLIKDKPIELTSKEFELLKVLIKAKGRVLSRDYLLDTIWGFDQALEIQTRTVDVHITTLRKKLKSESKRIITVKNYGYRFELDLDED